MAPIYSDYTKKSQTRCRSHDKGESSSWLQQLVLAAFKSKIEIDIAESVLTLITDSAYQTGGGFDLVPEGIRTLSSKFASLTEIDRRGFWAERKE
ncbi:uncharacterized protein M421DRAFT_4318 [Didymella exigua CBS 183.55]|uniref:Uncharacterized protein n=1 Tax=Didymella exigua CBS 183.55 TaxID=1150837 RepID=A0A6A5RR13_9PLEO|nr:uncharacterized protein M421DRAFT_4318 [Didymella exigua CBS 183.55]KAF1929893.1 hypothetical protein M421DRAFT_4318 [Didymella exigua CBS 183.55]